MSKPLLDVVDLHAGYGLTRVLHGISFALAEGSIGKLNTNSEYYGGTGVGNEGGRHTEAVPCNGFEHSINLTIPPLSTLMFKWTAEG